MYAGSLPEYLRDPELSIDNFMRQLKTFLFAQYWRWHLSALETLVPVSSINLLITLFTVHYVDASARNAGSATQQAVDGKVVKYSTLYQLYYV